MFVKICGIRNGTEARAAAEAGATALGVLCGLTHDAADAVAPATARAILAARPAEVEGVLVTHLLDAEAIAALADSVGASAVQVHDALPPEGMVRLRALLPGRRLIKAVHVTGEGAVGQARAWAPTADALLLDSRTADRLGGTGQTHDWSISRRIVAAVAPKPVYLAGGLRPENLAAAIAAVRPAGVDVNSGVEDSAGAKDPARLRAFVATARAALSAG
jgi:phosphoribosylanthranilate isomerase